MKDVKKKTKAHRQQKGKKELPLMPKDKPTSYGKEKLSRNNSDVEAELKGEQQAREEFLLDEVAGQTKRTPQKERESKEFNEDKIEEDPRH